MTRIRPGTVLAPRQLLTVRREKIAVPDRERIVHLQFRRFAGCVICKLHLRSIAARHEELVRAGILEVVVFQSTEDAVWRHQGTKPFPLVADPQRTLYAEFGVGRSLRSILDPRAWRAIARGLRTWRSGREGESALGLPAEFLIGPGGSVIAAKYGAHADDQWSVDEILQLACARAWIVDEVAS